MSIVDEKRDKPVTIDNVNENRVENLVVDKDAPQKPLVTEKMPKFNLGKRKEVALLLNPISQPPSSFQQSMKKKAKDGKY